MNFVLNSSLGASFALIKNFGEQQTQKSSFIPKISPKYKTSTAIRRICERSEAINTRIWDLKNADSATRAKIAESRLDSAPSQNLVNLNPCKAPKTKFLLLFAFAKRRVPLYLVIARKSVGFSCNP